MSNFHFTKVIAGVGPSLAKETVLSKVINMVDVFRINLSQGFDDNNKKYIDTILKLDNSKSIMLETKGSDVRVKNLLNVNVKKGQILSMDYSEYAQENDQKLFINYAQLDQLPVGLKIVFEQSGVELEIKEFDQDYAVCNILKG
jgi:pyruvate kinase